jgi:hypothetical protein
MLALAEGRPIPMPACACACAGTLRMRLRHYICWLLVFNTRLVKLLSQPVSSITASL